MSNIGGKTQRDKLLTKIKEYIKKDIFDVHYAENEKCEVRIYTTKKEHKYVMRYFHWLNLIVIWNANSNKGRYVLNHSINEIELECGCCKVFYTGQNKQYEKILVIHEDFLFDFLDDYDAFMRFNENDFEENSNGIIKEEKLEWGTLEERKKRCVLQKARDRKFREGVLKKYGYQCAICRCNIPQLLEAAHEREYEVCNTVNDMVEHGICLCRNHHAMYDRKLDDDSDDYLIDIDLENCAIQINDERIKQMPWYQVFCGNYGEKLLEQIH